MITGIFLALAAMMLFGELAEDVWHRELMTFDSIIIHWLAGFSSPGLTKSMVVITIMGSSPVLISVSLLTILMLYRRNKADGDLVLVLLALAGGWVSNVLLKWIFHRPRPEVAQLVAAGGYSFPSGHAMVGLSVYGFLAFLLWKNVRHHWLKNPAVLALILLILLIGVSRIYLGVHYPSDVLAGFSAGMIWLLGCMAVSRIIGRRCAKEY